MAIVLWLRLLSGVATFLLLLPPAAASCGAHRILKKYGLPKGLLPRSAKDYSLAADGSFVVHLKKPCYVQFNDLVYYDRTITGNISYGAISDINGVQIKKLFVWFPISSIRAYVDSESVEFKVGFISESFPVKQFKDIPHCIKQDKASARGAAGLFPEELLPVAGLFEPLSKCIT